MSGTEFLENFKSYITKAVCITQLNLLLQLMSGAIPILCHHGVQQGTSTYSQVVSWLNCQSNTFFVFPHNSDTVLKGFAGGILHTV